MSVVSEFQEFRSRHFGHFPMCLSRYKDRWYLNSTNGYGMPEGHTASEAPETCNRTFWNHLGADYVPDGPSRPGCPIHMLLDAEPQVARRTGRMRSETLPGTGDAVACYEVEVLIPEEGLRRQCYYCLQFEYEYLPRFKVCGDDLFWCNTCEERGQAVSATSRLSNKVVNQYIVPTTFNFMRKAIIPLFDGGPQGPGLWGGNPYLSENIYGM
ncbi:hypothetical protein BDZ89DRAFT_1114936 [Hymenopellis radicata]|nr:hypothetical protein BDZ89DRAFT_1114936 [Hymenopellis radicata]